ncbi:response regulator [Salidesulfovibrio onnuriiensis]|uniref:response regulator n=1 Tax=Salidesulfovibrio onnuriiensis TaxID=2583823 RepID=UPI0011C966C8|nr:response regulator [Salidesulfovibrio onnuriiensis]
MSKVQVLFVDDEPNVLAGIRRMLHHKRDEWDMYFAENGFKALEEFKTAVMDVVVSDIRMPVMDGIELLEIIRVEFPNTVRIALSGQVQLTDVIKSTRAVHQYITKPCSSEALVEKIEGALGSREVITDPAMQRLVTRLQTLPVIPEVFHAIELELAAEDPCMKTVAELVSQDVGLMAKLLNLVNSPYFGLPQKIKSIFQAINLLGINTIKTLILSEQLFDEFEQRMLPQFSLSRLWEHSFRVSSMACFIAECEGLDRETALNCRMAGILHDVGKLILVSGFPDEYSRVLRMVREQGVTVHVAEEAVFDTTHAQLGAYLMGLWGLPGEVILGIGHHHKVRERALSVPFIVSVADVIDHNCVILHPEYVRIEFQESLMESMYEDGYMERWLGYIQDHWETMTNMPGFKMNLLKKEVA